MPFTPYHIGFGILIKSFIQKHFSFIIFAWAQILMDIQPLLVLILGRGKLHGLSHTIIGAGVIGVLAGLSGEIIFRIFARYKRGFAVLPRINLYVSAFIGTYSHVILDDIMHADVNLFYPYTDKIDFYRIISLATLHKFCLFAGLLGLMIYFPVKWIISLYKNEL